MRRRALSAVALLLVGLVAACTSGSGGADTSAATTRDVTTIPSTTTTSAPPLVGQPLVIVEQGVSSFPDPFDRTASLGGYGVVIVNPDPELMATGVTVVTRILNPAGTELLVDRSLLNAIPPGSRMAVGRTLIEPIEDPTTLDVALEVSAWLPPTHDEGTLVADGAVTEPEEAGGSVTRFTIRSTWPDPEEQVDVTAIYRAADGRILGAESTTVAIVPAGGAVPVQIRLLSPIPDLATTEVFVGRGFAALTTG